MDGWDISILAIAAFFAVTMLARMMGEHRDHTLEHLRHEFQLEQQRRAEERRKQKQAERKRKRLEKQQAYIKQLEEKKRNSRAA